MILHEIIASTRQDVESRKQKQSLAELYKRIASDTSMRHPFGSSLASDGPVRLIAEFKQASPSKGLIRADLSLTEVVADYTANGAAAISMLTEPHFFKGQPEFLPMARKVTALPLLRKDFIIDKYQLVETRALGADAVLLIVAALSRLQLEDFLKQAQDLDLDCLVEVHTRQELDTALESGAQIIGINNRNLYTFETSLEKTFDLAKYVPGDRILVSESGISTRNDVERLAECGVKVVLVGEALMRSPSPGKKVQELVGVGN
jgi:indole-3-glycerol phosphate synthase